MLFQRISALKLPVVSHSMRLCEWIRYGPQCLLGDSSFQWGHNKRAIVIRVPQAFSNEGPSLVGSLLFIAILSLATVCVLLPWPFTAFCWMLRSISLCSFLPVHLFTVMSCRYLHLVNDCIRMPWPLYWRTEA